MLYARTKGRVSGYTLVSVRFNVFVVCWDSQNSRVWDFFEI